MTNENKMEEKVKVAGVTICMAMNCATQIVKQYCDEMKGQEIAVEIVALAKAILKEMEKEEMLR